MRKSQVKWIDDHPSNIRENYEWSFIMIFETISRILKIS